MDVFYETKRRLEVAHNIVSSIDNIVQGVMLGGSMGFGQNYSVREESDIDMVVVIERQKLPELLQTWYFNEHVPTKIQELFSKNDINMFWVTRIIDDVEVNAFVYERDDYEKFVFGEGNMRGFIASRPQNAQSSYAFNGEKITFDRKVRPTEGGFIYEKPGLVDGKFIGEASRLDYYYCGHVLYEKENYFTLLEKNVWKKTIQHLISEHGPYPDLSKYNILNLLFVYHKARERLSEEIVNKITDRTKKELEK